MSLVLGGGEYKVQIRLEIQERELDLPFEGYWEPAVLKGPCCLAGLKGPEAVSGGWPEPLYGWRRGGVWGGVAGEEGRWRLKSQVMASEINPESHRQLKDGVS